MEKLELLYENCFFFVVLRALCILALSEQLQWFNSHRSKSKAGITLNTNHTCLESSSIKTWGSNFNMEITVFVNYKIV